MSQVDRLARVLARLERDVRDLQRAPQLGYSSFDGMITQYDAGGRPVSQWGSQFDGTFGLNVVNGPKPPTPSKAIVTPVAGGLSIRWDGTFADGAIVPLDFARVEVHVCSAVGEYDGSRATMVGTIESPRGGDVVAVPLARENKVILLVARSQPGVASDPSEAAFGTPDSVVTDAELAELDAKLAEARERLAALDASQAALQTELDALPGEIEGIRQEVDAAVATKNTVVFADEEPVEDPARPWVDGDLWFKGQDRMPYTWDDASGAWAYRPFGSNALKPAAVGSEQLAEFAVTVTKFKSTRHFLY